MEICRLFNEVPERGHRRRWPVPVKGHHLSEPKQSGQIWSYAVNADMCFNAGTEVAFLAITGFAAIVRLKWSNRLILIKCNPKLLPQGVYARMIT